MCDFDLYIEQYQNGLLTKSELVERLSVSVPEPESFPIQKFAQINLDNVKMFVVSDCACHWGFFCENCSGTDLDSFCNVDKIRDKNEIETFVYKYI